MVLAVVVVVVAVIVVAVPIVADAVYDDHPLLLDPFPRTECADMPQRNYGRPCPVARMPRNVVAGDTGRRRRVVSNTRRRRMVARLRTGVMSMPCGCRRIDMTGRSSMLRRAWHGCWSRRLRSPCLLDRSCRVSVAAMVTAMVTAIRRSECRCAECRAGDSDECEFHDVVVHGIPSLSVYDLMASPSRPYIKQGEHGINF